MKCAKKALASSVKASKITGGGKPMGYVNNLKINNKGIYIYRVMVNGKVRTGSTGCKGEKAAEKRLIDIISELQQESMGTLKLKAPTFSKAIEIYEKNKKGMVSDQYLTNNVNILRLHFEPKIGTIFVDKITKKNLQECLQAYLSKSQSGKAIKTTGGYNQYLTILHSFFNEMKDCNYVNNLDGLFPSYEKQQKKVKRWIKEVDIEAFKDVIDTRFGIYKSVAVRMGLYLGLRSIEVVKAKWRMIDFSKKVFRNEDTKGKESDCIPMSDEMVAWFLKLKDKVGTVKPTDTIILDEDKKPAIRAFTRYAMEIAGKEVLGQKLSSHDMRRTFIMTLYYNGIKLDVIQRLARHKNIATTLQYIQENKEDEVAAIDQAFNKPSKTTENTVKKVS